MVTVSPLLDALGLEHVGEAADVLVQVLISDGLGVLGIVAFPDDRDLVAARGEMPVDAVRRHVGGAVLEPLDRDVAAASNEQFITVLNGLIQSMRLPCSAQNASGSDKRAGVHLLVARRIDQGMRRDYRLEQDRISRTRLVSPTLLPTAAADRGERTMRQTSGRKQAAASPSLERAATSDAAPA